MMLFSHLHIGNTSRLLPTFWLHLLSALSQPWLHCANSVDAMLSMSVVNTACRVLGGNALNKQLWTARRELCSALCLPARLPTFHPKYFVLQNIYRVSDVSKTKHDMDNLCLHYNSFLTRLSLAFWRCRACRCSTETLFCLMSRDCL
jgi:hypothetical protein